MPALPLPPGRGSQHFRGVAAPVEKISIISQRSRGSSAIGLLRLCPARFVGGQSIKEPDNVADAGDSEGSPTASAGFWASTDSAAVAPACDAAQRRPGARRASRKAHAFARADAFRAREIVVGRWIGSADGSPGRLFSTALAELTARKQAGRRRSRPCAERARPRARRGRLPGNGRRIPRSAHPAGDMISTVAVGRRRLRDRVHGGGDRLRPGRALRGEAGHHQRDQRTQRQTGAVRLSGAASTHPGWAANEAEQVERILAAAEESAAERGIECRTAMAPGDPQRGPRQPS